MNIETVNRNIIKFDENKIIDIFHFSKDETDQEAVEIRQKCEDYVININDLQNEILIIKKPIRRVNNIIIKSIYSTIISNDVFFLFQFSDFIF